MVGGFADKALLLKLAQQLVSPLPGNAHAGRQIVLGNVV